MMSADGPESEAEAAADRGEQPGRGSPGGRWRVALPVVLIVVIAGGAAALIASSSGGKPQLPAGERSAHATSFDGALLEPVKQAPALSTLHNYQGQPVDLAHYRGKAVFLTFLYTHCPDVCPLIASQLHNSLVALGPKAAQVQLIAVSVDPRGDTPAAVASFLSRHELTGQMQFLIGSAHELGPVWKTWGVGSEQDASNPEFINHSALIYGITASGKLRTIYSANFKPREIVHDVPALLAG
jgi:protein SCO1/2